MQKLTLIHPEKKRFDDRNAFQRNLGWVTEIEANLLKTKKVAIAGMGGVGGSHLLTLARLGVGKFTIADLDTFELANFNRQVGANLSSIGRKKVDVLAEMALEINPELQLERFEKGVQEENIDDFLKGADLFIDGFDFFVLGIRRKVFARCRELGIPAITAAPLGMGTAWLIFTPEGMSFEDYFAFSKDHPEENFALFITGLSPKAAHQHYLAEPSRLDLKNQIGPSTIMGCQLCASVAATEALKILLHRGRIQAAPSFHLFDAYEHSYSTGKLRWGNRGPLQSFKRWMLKRKMKKIFSAPKLVRQEKNLKTDLEKILDQARWAPSGDNSQPWKFEILNSHQVRVFFEGDGAPSIYDLDHRGHWLSMGCLLENISIAANHFGYFLEESYIHPDAQTHFFDLTLRKEENLPPNPLFDFIPLRTVDRFPYQNARLSPLQKKELEDALGSDFGVLWYENLRERLRVAKLIDFTTGIRLKIPEAFESHRKVLDWENPVYSSRGLPVKTVGFDWATQRLLKWGMKSWKRMQWMNRICGIFIPKFELDWIPGIFCAAQFFLTCKKELKTPLEQIEAGKALQRFWLKASSLGLVLQPNYAPLAFANYARANIPFTKEARFLKKAQTLAARIEHQFYPLNHLFFLGRIGYPRFSQRNARSGRLTLQELTVSSKVQEKKLDLKKAS